MSLNILKDKIKDLPISRVISEYIPLDHKGAATIGLCPFHDDSKPSLNVNDSKGMFMCFVCQTGGDAITFVEKYKNLDFKDALIDISERVGIPYEEFINNEKISPKAAMGIKILTKASILYKKIATNNCDYFNQFASNRKLSPETLNLFGIGFASQNNILSTYLLSIKDKKEREFALQIALEISIIRLDEKRSSKGHNHYYDNFRDRIIFPIWDQFGNIVGFGGRKIKEYQKAKYLNSRESFIFNKKNILYGLHLAKPHIRQHKSVILVEGYMDLITLHQYGISNSVAVMGVGISDYSISNLKALCSNIYLGLDSDSAGLTASARINQICMKHGIIPKHIDFSPYKDPDEFLVNEGFLKLQERIDNAQYFIDTLIEQKISDPIPQTSSQKLNLLNAIFKLLSPLGSSLEATERVGVVKKRLGLKSDNTQIIGAYTTYLSELKSSYPQKYQEKRENQHNQPYNVTIDSKQNLSNDTPETDPTLTTDIEVEKKKAHLSKTEKIFIEISISYPQCLLNKNYIKLLDFIDNSDIKRFALKIKKLVWEVDEANYISLISKIVATDEFPLAIREMVGIAIYNYQSLKVDDKLIARLICDFKKKLQEDQLINRKKLLKEKQLDCMTMNEENDFLIKVMEIDQQIQALKSKNYKQNRNFN